MPTDIELSYLEQGYQLPDGLDWARVAALRARRDIDPIFVPLTLSPGCIGWGVPFVDGRHLRHPPGCDARRRACVAGSEGASRPSSDSCAAPAPEGP
jgi:hypothetical protein